MSAWSLANSIFDERNFYFLAKFTVFQILLFYLALFYHYFIILFYYYLALLCLEVRLPVFEKKCEILVSDKAGILVIYFSISLLKSCFSS